MKNIFISLLKDVRFWLAFFLIVRLYGITQPPLETAHNWRQTTGTMVARNFYETDPDIRFPRLDTAGEKSGITGMEFPLLNYMHYLLSLIFGYAHWYGRLINLIFTTLGVYCFYRLVRKFYDEGVAFPATMILLVSIWFCYARKVMPDTFAASLAIAGIYFGFNFFYRPPGDKKNIPGEVHLLLFAIFSTAGMLSKLPVAALFPVFLLVYFDRNILLKRKLIFAAMAVITVFPAVYWYFYWVPLLNETFQYGVVFMGVSFRQGAADLLHNAALVCKQFYDSALKYIGFGAFLFGLFMMFRMREKRLITICLLVAAAFFIFVLKSGNNFARHSYYIVPFVPVMALVAGYGLSKLPWRKVAIVILFFVCAENIANQYFDFRISPKNRCMLQLETSLDTFSKRTDRVAFNSGEVPTPMYFAHRRGWLTTNEELQKPEFLNELTGKGCRLVVIMKRTCGTPVFLPLKLLEENEDWCIYSLSR